MTSIPSLDRATAMEWVDRWDRQQDGYVHGRERAFGLVYDVIERLRGRPRRILDLASGPGALSVRALQRFPGVEVVALDLDPVLVEIGRRAHGDAIRWVEADLRHADWVDALDGARFDAVVTATALHYLDAEHLPHVAAGVAKVLEPGGIFVDCDTMLTDPSQPRLAALTEAMRRDAWEAAFEDREDFAAWWKALQAEVGFEDLFAERTRRFGSRRYGDETTITERVAALRAAGFVEVAPVAQDLDKVVLVSILAG